MKDKKKIDPRITKAIKAGEKVKNALQNAAARKRLDEEVKEQKRVAAYSKQADKWVEDKLFALIAKAEAAGSNRVEISSSNDPYIPQEALIKAVKKIEGLTVESVWDEGWSDPDSGMIISAHYDYYVKWKKDPYEGYPY